MPEIGQTEREQADLAQLLLLEELKKAYRKYQQSNRQKDFDTFIRLCEVILK